MTVASQHPQVTVSSALTAGGLSLGIRSINFWLLAIA